MSISQAPEIGETAAATAAPPKKEGSAAPGRKPVLLYPGFLSAPNQAILVLLLVVSHHVHA